MAKVKATFKMEKATKNTIRFEEVLESEFSAPKIGSVYIPKSTLGEIGWTEEKKIDITVDVAK